MGPRKKNHRTLSHSLSWALRHAGPEIGLTMTSDGFVPVKEVLASEHPKLRGWTLEDVQQVVESNDKQRFKLEMKRAEKYNVPLSEADDNGEILCVRANQGHSIAFIDPEQLMRRLSQEELSALPVIIHGTYKAPWTIIKDTGLSRMKRTHIHFASGLPHDEGVISGMRRKCDTYIYINAKKCAEDGIIFYQSDNGVLLTAGIDEKGLLPSEYFSHVIGADGEVLMDHRHKV